MELGGARAHPLCRWGPEGFPEEDFVGSWKLDLEDALGRVKVAISPEGLCLNSQVVGERLAVSREGQLKAEKWGPPWGACGGGQPAGLWAGRQLPAAWSESWSRPVAPDLLCVFSLDLPG